MVAELVTRYVVRDGAVVAVQLLTRKDGYKIVNKKDGDLFRYATIVRFSQVYSRPEDAVAAALASNSDYVARLEKDLQQALREGSCLQVVAERGGSTYAAAIVALAKTKPIPCMVCHRQSAGTLTNVATGKPEPFCSEHAARAIDAGTHASEAYQGAD